MVMHITQRPEAKLKGAVIASIIVSLTLLIIKFIAYALTGSAAILSDATESIVNVIAAGFAFYSLKVSIKPPDECHPYGHGKAEFLSAAFEGGAIIVAAIWIIYKAVHELVTGPDFHQLSGGIWLLAVATIINLILGLCLLRAGKKGNSLILIADGKHVLTDVSTSIGVLIGLVIMAWTNFFAIDAIIAIAVAGGILRTGYILMRTAFGGMMDAADEKDEAVIKSILANAKFHDVCGYHKLRHRLSGVFHFVDFHLIFPKNLSVEQAHAMATAIEAQVANALGNASVMAHIEPCKKPDCPNCRGK